MHYAGTRNPRAETNPLRSIPLTRSASRVFGSSARDRLVGAVNKAVQFRDGWAREYAKARAGLGRANRIPAPNRRHSQAHAMRQLTAVRKGMKVNLRAIAAAEAALAVYDANPPLPGFEQGGRHTLQRRSGGPAWPMLPTTASTPATAP